MKNILFMTGAAMALISTPALAQTGYIGGSYVNSQVETPLGDAETDGWAAEGSIAFDVGSLGATLNAGYADSDVGDGVYVVGGHLYGRGASSLFGGFASVGGTDDNTRWSAGLEAQRNLSHGSLALSAGYASDEDDTTATDADIWGLDGRAMVFPTDNFSVNGRLAYQNIDVGIGQDNAYQLGAGMEWQMSALPVSFLADVSHTQTNDTDISVDAFRVGLRYNFGGQTLKARNQSGADFASLSSLGRPLAGF